MDISETSKDNDITDVPIKIILKNEDIVFKLSFW